MIPAVTALSARVRQAVSHVGVFELVYRLERILAPRAAVGGDEPAAGERIHFTHAPAFDFPPGDMTELTIAPAHGDDEAPDVTLATTALGLVGAESPLIPAITEAVADDAENGYLQAFFDVFQHRAYSLLYRAWKRYSPVAGFDSKARGSFERALLSLVGVDPFGHGPLYAEQGRGGHRFVLGLSDYIRCEPSFLDALSLAAITERVFPELDPKVSQADPGFVPFELDEQTKLGIARSVLGVNAVYGSGAEDVDGALRLVVRPVDAAMCAELVPGGRLYRELYALCEQWIHGRVGVQLEVVLPREHTPSLTIGGHGGSALGVDTCIIGDAATIVRLRVPLVADGEPADRSYHDH